MGDSAQYIKISGNGRNALDFHIAFYVGQLAMAEPSARFYIVSKDQGFDPLIEHLKTKGIAAARVADLSMIAAKRIAPKVEADRTASVITKKQLAPQDIASIIQALQRNGTIAVKDNKVAYLLP